MEDAEKYILSTTKEGVNSSGFYFRYNGNTNVFEFTVKTVNNMKQWSVDWTVDVTGVWIFYEVKFGESTGLHVSANMNSDGMLTNIPLPIHCSSQTFNLSTANHDSNQGQPLSC